MEFLVGDTVRIVPDKKWYDDGNREYLEKVGVVGTIVEYSTGMPLVQYEDGESLYVLTHEIEKVEEFFVDTGSF